MALKVKAVERLVKFTKAGEGTLRYVMQPELYTALSQAKVIKEAALRSGVSRGVMQACWDAAGEVIKAWATEGHSVALPGLGTMRFGMNAKTCGTVEEVKSSLITTRKVVFTPNVELKKLFASYYTPQLAFTVSAPISVSAIDIRSYAFSIRCEHIS